MQKKSRSLRNVSIKIKIHHGIAGCYAVFHAIFIFQYSSCILCVNDITNKALLFY